MRTYVDLASHASALKNPSNKPLITQVEMKAPNLGTLTPVNGRYILCSPDGVSLSVDLNSYVLPVDGGDLSSRGFAELLAKYPMYEYIFFNPILTDQDLSVSTSGGFDPTATFPDGVNTWYPRYQTGRVGSGVDDGNSPTSTAILPANTTVSPVKPGMMITSAIDISPYVGSVSSGGGADQFMVYWKIYEFVVTHDILSSTNFGVHGVKNQPSHRQIKEIAQEPTDFSVYLSIDGGTTWHSAKRLEPLSFCCKVDSLKIAFKNDSGAKVYLAHYGVMF